jgi:ABC-type transport system involved in multi-copper enzyme maturation permease subunit
MIPKEREARTLPLLLATPLEAGQIVRDKALAVLRQSLPMLVPPLLFFLFASACVLVSVANQLPPLLLARIAGLYLGFYLAGLLGILPFLLGLGLYCGVRLKTIAAARGCTFTVVLLGALVFCVVAAAVALFIVRSGSRVWLTLPVVAVGAALVCAGAGLVLLRATARQLRRHVF